VSDPRRSDSAPPYGDALTAPFWEAAARHELIVQRCESCGAHQFYPRPYCLACDSSRLEWVRASGAGTVVTKTTVHIQVTPEWQPPYVVAIVRLEEGPTLLTNLMGDECEIGARVKVSWRERVDAPPFPVFHRAGGR
jgi:uncharacterized OB-fold protein